MSVDDFLAGLNLDSDDDDEPPLPPPKRPPSRPLKNIRGGVTFGKDLIKQSEDRKALGRRVKLEWAFPQKY